MDYDVAVVGAGIAGLMCVERLSRLRPHARIAALEQGPLGGSSAMSVGSITAAGTPQQELRGITDSPLDHARQVWEMCELDGSGNDVRRYRELLEMACLDGADILAFLSGLGVEFSGPHHESPHAQPRMHNSVPDGRAVVDALVATVAARRHVRMLPGRTVRSVHRADGGVRIETSQASVEARHLVLATGDCSGVAGPVPGLNHRADGALMADVARTFDAPLHEPLAIPGLRTVVPYRPHVAPSIEIAHSGTLLVEREETSMREILAAPQHFADKDIFLRMPAGTPPQTRICTYPGLGYATLTDLVDAGISMSTEAGRITMGPMRLVVTLADGGLDVDTSMRLLDGDGDTVPSILTCGAAALGGIRIEGHGHHLLWAAFSGGRAATSVAAEL